MNNFIWKSVLPKLNGTESPIDCQRVLMVHGIFISLERCARIVTAMRAQ